jgi:hypothetical protein
MSSLDTRRERAAGAVLEDERLRGGLTDNAYSPLQQWALDWVDAYVYATARLEDADGEPRIEAGIDWTKAQLRALVSLLDQWSELDRAARARELGRLAPTFPAPALAKRADAVAKLDQAEAAAKPLVAALPAAPHV